MVDHGPWKDIVVAYSIQNYNLYVWLLDPKKQKSSTCGKFEIFHHDPNLTSNFEIHKNVGDIFFLYI